VSWCGDGRSCFSMPIHTGRFSDLVRARWWRVERRGAIPRPAGAPRRNTACRCASQRQSRGRARNQIAPPSKTCQGDSGGILVFSSAARENRHLSVPERRSDRGSASLDATRSRTTARAGSAGRRARPGSLYAGRRPTLPIRALRSSLLLSPANPHRFLKRPFSAVEKVPDPFSRGKAGEGLPVGGAVRALRRPSEPETTR
jgi:hypothetical protein